jgi:hypothetical protein
MTKHDPNPRAVAGGNFAPAVDPDVLAAEEARVREFADAARDWVKKGEITNDADASDLADFIAGARKVKAAVKEAHDKAAEPHKTAKAAVDKAFNALALAIATALGDVGKIQTAYMQRKRAALLAAQAEAKKRAEAAAKAAAEARAAAERRGDIYGTASAEAACVEAERARKAAEAPVKAQVQSATGGARTMALRVTRGVRITNVSLAFRSVQGHPDVTEAIRKVIAAAVRSKDWNGSTPPGCEVFEEEKAV